MKKQATEETATNRDIPLILNILGTDTKVGTTMVCQCLGEALARKDLATLIILQGGPKGFEYLSSENENGNYMLFSKDKRRMDELSLEEVKRLLTGFAKEYDYVLFDSGACYDTAAAIGAIEMADKNIIVTTQQQRSLDGLSDLVAKVIKPLGINPDLIINKFIKGSYASKQEISQLGEFAQVHTLSYFPTGWDRELSRTSFDSNLRFRKEIENYEKTI